VTIAEALRARNERRKFEAWRAQHLGGSTEALEASFERALAGLWIGFQPIVHAVDGVPFGYEALVRSDEPAMAVPAALFSAAAKLERMVEFGRKIRAMVAEQLPAAPADATVFVNVNPDDLADPQ